MKLTPKQKAFADYYIQSCNATEAAIKAGYSKKTARQIAADNLTKVYIKDYIAEKMKELEDSRIAKADEVLKYLTSVLRGEATEEVIVTENIGDYMSEAKVINKQVSAKERIKAAELIGKRYALFTEKVNLEGNIGVVIIDDVGIEDD